MSGIDVPAVDYSPCKCLLLCGREFSWFVEGEWMSMQVSRHVKCKNFTWHDGAKKIFMILQSSSRKQEQHKPVKVIGSDETSPFRDTPGGCFTNIPDFVNVTSAIW